MKYFPDPTGDVSNAIASIRTDDGNVDPLHPRLFTTHHGVALAFLILRPNFITHETSNERDSTIQTTSVPEFGESSPF